MFWWLSKTGLEDKSRNQSFSLIAPKKSKQSTTFIVPFPEWWRSRPHSSVEKRIEALTRQNVELLLITSGQSHPAVNQDEHEEEEERNSHANSHVVRRTIAKKKIFERIITENKETEGPTIVETNEKMQET
jgi:hypothetical protein